MTGEEWLNGKQSIMLIEGLRQTFSAGRTKESRRRLRLFSCAALRRVWDILEPESQVLVERLEAVCVGLEPENNLKTLAETAGHRATLHWYANVWDQYLRQAVSHAVGLRHTAQGASSAASLVAAALLNRLLPPTAGGPLVLQSEITLWQYAAQCAILHDIFGNPFHPLPPREFPVEARGLAQAWLHGETSVLPVLIDALSDLGEDGAVAHLRQPTHVRGCHVIDWVLGRA
jgi:hypothetical protein